MADTIRPPGNLDYFARRESQERALAERAEDRAVRRAHLSMAERYAALTGGQDKPPILAQPAAA